MAMPTFFSFHYIPDGWRASQVKNMGVLEGKESVSDNDWERITRSGDDTIKRWIDGQMSGRKCLVILIGSATAGRKWINYEIKKAWGDEEGVVGIYVNNLLDADGNKSLKGRDPFAEFTLADQRLLSDIVRAHDPPYLLSKDVYRHIAENMRRWVDEAITIRNRH